VSDADTVASLRLKIRALERDSARWQQQAAYWKVRYRGVFGRANNCKARGGCGRETCRDCFTAVTEEDIAEEPSARLVDDLQIAVPSRDGVLLQAYWSRGERVEARMVDGAPYAERGRQRHAAEVKP